MTNKRIKNKNKHTRKQNGGWPWSRAAPAAIPVIPASIENEPVVPPTESRMEKAQKVPITYMFIRHALSCNNLLKEQGYGPAKLIYGDADPSLTLYGMKNLSSIRRKTPGFKGTLFVSCLIRTWQSAILEFYKKTNQLAVDLHLIVAPFIKETGSDKENMPLPHDQQINKMNVFITTLLSLLDKEDYLPTIYVTTRDNAKIQLHKSDHGTITHQTIFQQKGGACTTYDQYVKDIPNRNIQSTSIFEDDPVHPSNAVPAPIVNIEAIRTDLFTSYYGENALFYFNSWYRSYYTDPQVFIVSHSGLMQKMIKFLSKDYGLQINGDTFNDNSWAFTIDNGNNQFKNLEIMSGIPKPENAKAMCNTLEPLCFKEPGTTVKPDQHASNQLKPPRQKIRYTKKTSIPEPIKPSSLPVHERLAPTRAELFDAPEAPPLLQKSERTVPSVPLPKFEVTDTLFSSDTVQKSEPNLESVPAQPTLKKYLPDYTCKPPIMYSDIDPSGPYTIASKTVASNELLLIIRKTKSELLSKVFKSWLGMSTGQIQSEEENPFFTIYTDFNTNIDAFFLNGEKDISRIIELLNRYNGVNPSAYLQQSSIPPNFIQNHYIALAFISPEIVKHIFNISGDQLDSILSHIGLNQDQIVKLTKKIQRLYSNPDIYNIIFEILLKHSNALYYHSNSGRYKTLLDLFFDHWLDTFLTNAKVKREYADLVSKKLNKNKLEDVLNDEAVKVFKTSCDAKEQDILTDYVNENPMYTTMKFIIDLVQCGALFSTNDVSKNWGSFTTQHLFDLHIVTLMDKMGKKYTKPITPIEYLLNQIHNYCAPENGYIYYYNMQLEPYLKGLIKTIIADKEKEKANAGGQRLTYIQKTKKTKKNKKNKKQTHFAR